MIVLIANGITPQVSDKENIAVLPFSGWSDTSTAEAKIYQDAITDKIITRIIHSHRFNVIDRHELYRLLSEHDMYLTGLVEDYEAMMAEAGRIIGVDKFVTGTFTRNSTDYHEGYEDRDGKVEPHYAVDIQATIKLFDVEGARYIETTKTTAHSKEPTKTKALQNAQEKLADNVIASFEQYFAVQANIASIDKSTVLLDRGYALGIREGATFEVIKQEEGAVDPVSGEIDEGKVASVGAVYISEVKPDYSKGKIIKGIFTMREGMLVKGRDIPMVNWGISVSYAPLKISVRPNKIKGTYTVSNPYTGSHEVDIDYTEYDVITNGSIMQISLYRRNLVKDISWGIAYDHYTLSEILSSGIGNVYLSYHWSMIPDLLFISPAIGIGWGKVSQRLPGGIVSKISDGESSTLSSKYRLSISAQLGVRTKLGPLIFTVEVCYRSFKTSKWDYRVKTGKITTRQTGDGDEEEVEETATTDFDPGLAVYPGVNLSSVYFKIGIAVELPKFW